MTDAFLPNINAACFDSYSMRRGRLIFQLEKERTHNCRQAGFKRGLPTGMNGVLWVAASFSLCVLQYYNITKVFAAPKSEMSIFDQISIDEPRPIQGARLESRARSVLERIRAKGVSLTIWNRSLSGALQSATTSISALMPVHRQFTLAPQDSVCEPLIAAVRAFPGLSESAARVWREDLTELVMLARTVDPAAPLRVFVQSRACHGHEPFHTDHVPLRLICTYRGAGTQYLSSESMGASVREVPTGAVAVIKGKQYPGEPNYALLHRSPPAEPTWPRIVALIDILP